MFLDTKITKEVELKLLYRETSDVTRFEGDMIWDSENRLFVKDITGKVELTFLYCDGSIVLLC